MNIIKSNLEKRQITMSNIKKKRKKKKKPADIQQFPKHIYIIITILN
jgi:hypothetical protein